MKKKKATDVRALIVYDKKQRAHVMEITLADGSKIRGGPLRGVRVKKNPSGLRIVYNKLLGGWYVVRGPHQTPLNGRFDSKLEAQAYLRGDYRKNPKRRARSAKKYPGGRAAPRGVKNGVIVDAAYWRDMDRGARRAKFTQLRGQRTGKVYALFNIAHWDLKTLKAAATMLARKHGEPIAARVISL